MNSDRMLGLLTFALGAGVLVAGFGIVAPPGTEDSLSPRFFPLLLAFALMLLGGALAIRGGGVSLRIVRARVFSRTSLVLLGFTLAYTLSFGLVDYRVGAFLFMSGGMWLLGSRARWELAVIPVVVAVLMYGLFRYGFLVLLPIWG